MFDASQFSLPPLHPRTGCPRLARTPGHPRFQPPPGTGAAQPVSGVAFRNAKLRDNIHNTASLSRPKISLNFQPATRMALGHSQPARLAVFGQIKPSWSRSTQPRARLVRMRT